MFYFQSRKGCIAFKGNKTLIEAFIHRDAQKCYIYNKTTKSAVGCVNVTVYNFKSAEGIFALYFERKLKRNFFFFIITSYFPSFKI